MKSASDDREVALRDLVHNSGRLLKPDVYGKMDGLSIKVRGRTAGRPWGYCRNHRVRFILRLLPLRLIPGVASGTIRGIEADHGPRYKRYVFSVRPLVALQGSTLTAEATAWETRMPVFHIDLDLGGALLEDLEGVDLPNLQAAEAYCIAGLIEVARGAVTAHAHERFTTILRDEARNLILERTMTLTCELR
jgi:hypothetical protein